MLTKEGALSVLAAFFIVTASAFANGWGVLHMYITSYLRIYDSSVTVNQVDFALTVYSLVYGVAVVVSVSVVDRLGPKLTNLIGSITIACGFLMCGLVTHVWLFVALFGLVVGFGGGFSYMTGINVALRHFTKHRGKALGCCASGAAWSILVFGLLFTYIVNPNNALPVIESLDGAQTVKYFSPDIAKRVPYAFFASALVALLLGIAASLLMQVKELPPVQLTDNNEEEMLSQKSYEPEPVTTVSQAVRQAKFWKLFWALYCGQSFCIWVMVSYKSFGSLYINDDHFLSYAGATGAVMNGVARLCYPVLLDYFSYIAVNMFSLGAEAALAIAICICVHNKIAYVVVVSAVFFIQGTQFFPLSLYCLNEYGPVLGPKVFSYVAFGGMIAFAMPGIYYWLVVEHYGYFTSYIIQGLQSLIGLLLTYSLRKSSKKSLSEVSSKQSFA
jgi:MFS family permease